MFNFHCFELELYCSWLDGIEVVATSMCDSVYSDVCHVRGKNF